MATTATPWIGYTLVKLLLQSGQFTSTLKTSEYVGGLDLYLQGISYDGVDTPWVGGQTDKFRLQSGQFSSTLKTSQYFGDIATSPVGISYDGADTPWADNIDDKLFLQSGQFTSTLKTSLYVGNSPDDVSADLNGDTPWTDYALDKLFLQSGQFTSTVKDSEYIGGIDNKPKGISYDGVNTPWCGTEATRLYLQSGQFTSTLKTSQDTSGIDADPRAICTDDYEGRTGINVLDIFANASDAATIIDTAAFDAVYVVAASDAVTLNDTAAFDAVAASDAVTLNDTATFDAVYVVPAVAASDAVIINDTATARIAFRLTFYGSLEEADGYFEQRLHEWAWLAASVSDKENALIAACRLIDALNFKGYKHTVYEVREQWGEGVELDDDKRVEIRAAELAQLLEFPRRSNTSVPEDIRIAQYELAHSLLDNKDPDLELELLAVTSATYGGVKTVYQRDQVPLEHLINLIPNAVAWRLLRPYLRDGDATKLSRVS